MKLSRDGYYVILDLSGATVEDARRIVDFMIGADPFAQAKAQKFRGATVMIKPKYDYRNDIIGYGALRVAGNDGTS